MARNGDRDQITRALRDISHIEDGMVVKTLKGVLERELRLVQRIDDLEDDAAESRKALRPAGSK